MFTLNDLINHLEKLRNKHGGDIPIFLSSPDSIHGHNIEHSITEDHVGFISEDNPIRFSGDLDPQISRISIFSYPRFKAAS